MRLLLQRSERTVLFAHQYVLTATLLVSENEWRVMRDHQLLGCRAYIVSDAFDHERRAEAALERQKNLSVFRSNNSLTILKYLVVGIIHSCRAMLAFKITYQQLIDGKLIICPNMQQLVACEEDIKAAFDRLQCLVTDCLSFEQQREQLFAPDTENATGIAPPHAWPQHHQWGR